MSTTTRLNRAFTNALHLPLHQGTRYVLFSDCHRGSGNSNDNFLTNQHIYLATLKYYYENRYTYLELGDGDELWENRKMQSIIDVHSNIFELFTCFHKQNRLFLLYGKTLSLVKWFMSTRANQSVFIARELVAGPFEIDLLL